jgi:hypothetical protein
MKERAKGIFNEESKKGSKYFKYIISSKDLFLVLK